MKRQILLLFTIFTSLDLFPQQTQVSLFCPSFSFNKIENIDLDQDGDPDVLRSFINDSVPVQWIDDDDDMKTGDIQGDIDNDCLMIDRNRDGRYGDEFDLMIDWCDENNDGKADLQIVADNAARTDRGWTPGHFMISIDTDGDQVFNHINWNTLRLEAWEHEGQCRFFQDYSGKTMFLKIHTSSFNINDLRYNWENPFLFYDEDNDGLSEMALRFVDAPTIDFTQKYPVTLSHKITDARFSVDMDNDTRPGNEFDFDMSLKFTGEGFDYSKHIHDFKSLRGLPAADTFFLDPRWRQMTELIYVEHKNAFKAMYKEGKWSQCWFVFDEDDDCQRWERVEFYEPKDFTKIGAKQGGLDNNPQADATGDRGEWDTDNSGKGKLYIGKFDGLIHLFGAETGAWRIDEHATYFQGWQGWRGGGDTIPHDFSDDEPTSFQTIKYSDTDNNGFIDRIEYDMNSDQKLEKPISLIELGMDDRCQLYDVSTMKYSDYRQLFEKVSTDLWKTSQKAIQVARKYKINTGWYSYYLQPKSTKEKYHFGYWLNYYLYNDLHRVGENNKDTEFLKKLDLAYFSGNWELLLK